MTVDQALKLKAGESKVFVNYKPNAGHGETIVERATVINIAPTIQKNLNGDEYVFVTVKPFRGQPAYVLASFFITEMV